MWRGLIPVNVHRNGQARTVQKVGLIIYYSSNSLELLKSDIYSGQYFFQYIRFIRKYRGENSFEVNICVIKIYDFAVIAIYEYFDMALNVFQMQMNAYVIQNYVTMEVYVITQRVRTGVNVPIIGQEGHVMKVEIMFFLSNTRIIFISLSCLSMRFTFQSNIKFHKWLLKQNVKFLNGSFDRT